MISATFIGLLALWIGGIIVIQSLLWITHVRIIRHMRAHNYPNFGIAVFLGYYVHSDYPSFLTQRNLEVPPEIALARRLRLLLVIWFVLIIGFPKLNNCRSPILN